MNNNLNTLLINFNFKKTSLLFRAIFLIIFFMMMNLFLFNSSAHANDSIKNTSTHPIVPILQFVEHPALDATRKGIESELTKAGYRFVYESAQGNSALSTQIAQKFVGQTPKILVSIGTNATQSLIISNRTQNIPIIFSSVTDPLNSRIVSNLLRPSENVTGVSNFINPMQQFKIFKKVMPQLKRLGIIYNPGEANSVALMSVMLKEAQKFDIQLIEKPAMNTREVTDATLSIINDVDAIFINNDNTALAAFDSITKIATQNKIPVFVSDTDLLEKGAIAALGPNQFAIGVQTGKMIVRVLKGQKVEDLQVTFPDQVELHLNMKVLKALDMIVLEDVKKEATRLYE